MALTRKTLAVWPAYFISFAILFGSVDGIRAQSSGQGLPNPYYAVENWARDPKWLTGHVYAPAVDSQGHVWILRRCGGTSCGNTNEPALLEFDSSGNFIRGIGQGMFAFPHGLFVDRDDNLWVADDGVQNGKGNQVVKLSQDGKILVTLGKKGEMGGSPDNFIGPCSVLVTPAGDIFVTDGHAILATGGGVSLGFDAKRSDPAHMGIVKFSKDGKFIKRWGAYGRGPGEFDVPHALAMDSLGRIFVADRGNNRIQIFDQDGKFLDQWKQFGKPVSIFIDSHDTLYSIDSDSEGDLVDWKFSSVGSPCANCRFPIPRLVDVGLQNQDFVQGIRIGSAKDGIVRAFVPPPMGPRGPISLPEYLWADSQGSLYVAAPRTERFTKYVKNVELPEGPGKELVQRACSSCHGFNEFPKKNYDHEEWASVVKTMAGGGAPLKDDEIPIVTDYLANNFKGKDTPGVQVSGSVQVNIEEWDVPTPASNPTSIYCSDVNHLVWFTAPFANAVVRFDPKTHDFREYQMPPGTDPISLVEYPAINIRGVNYFAPTSGTFIGRFHPINGPYAEWKEGDVVENPTSSPTLQFHHIALSIQNASEVWFTANEGSSPLFGEGRIGSLTPMSMEVKLYSTPTKHATPGEIAVNDAGIPFFTESDGGRLGTVNPYTSQVTEYPLPNAESGPRGITITPDDVVWYTDYLRGYLGRFDPKTGKFDEWPSPSGTRSQPLAIANSGDIIWYAETGTKPNMLVRFDPKSQKFQSWPIKAGGNVQQIFADPDGSLWFTRPLANGIAHATIKEGPSVDQAGK